jgi:hypothetical protein
MAGKECVSDHSNGEEAFDPIRALARRYLHIRQQSSDPETYLSAVFDDKGSTDVTDKDIRAALKLAAAVLDYTRQAVASPSTALILTLYALAEQMLCL